MYQLLSFKSVSDLFSLLQLCCSAQRLKLHDQLTRYPVATETNQSGHKGQDSQSLTCLITRTKGEKSRLGYQWVSIMVGRWNVTKSYRASRTQSNNPHLRGKTVVLDRDLNELGNEGLED